MIAESRLPEGVKKRALAIFARLAEAEAEVHGMAPADVAFHEVGAVDSIVDIVGVAIGLEALGITRLTCSPLPLGRGFVTCQHGRIPIPAPATLELLRGLPIESSDLKFELVTPTGAAIVAALVDDFCTLPSFRLQRVGYGAGTRRLPDRPNMLRVLLGEVEKKTDGEPLLQVEVNLDDLSPEILAYAMEKLLAEGARDVWVTPVQMKKGRSGHCLGLLCTRPQLAFVQEILFRETSTLGFRYFPVSRHVMTRQTTEIETSFGLISIKTGDYNGETVLFAPEFEDCRAAAEKYGVPLKEVYTAALSSYQQKVRG